MNSFVSLLWESFSTTGRLWSIRVVQLCTRLAEARAIGCSRQRASPTAHSSWLIVASCRTASRTLRRACRVRSGARSNWSGYCAGRKNLDCSRRRAIQPATYGSLAIPQRWRPPRESALLLFMWNWRAPNHPAGCPVRAACGRACRITTSAMPSPGLALQLYWLESTRPGCSVAGGGRELLRAGCSGQRRKTWPLGLTRSLSRRAHPTRSGSARFAHFTTPPFLFGAFVRNSQGFIRRRRVYCERMHTGPELTGKRFINHAMSGESALPPKRIGHDINPEMRLSPRSMSGMAFVLAAFIKYLQAQRSEGFTKLPR